MHIFVNGEPVNRFVRNADAESPAGGVSSSARDLAEWVRLQLNGGKWNGKQIVDAGALAETRERQICRNPADAAKPDACPGDQYYGLGWDVGLNVSGPQQVNHSGAFFQGAATSVYLIPEEHLGILVLTNSQPVGLPESICLQFLDLVHYGKAKHDYLSILGPLFEKMIAQTQDESVNYANLTAAANSAPAKPLSAYAGTYANDYFGNLQVEVKGDRLILRLPPRGAYYELSHWEADTFTYYYASESTGAGPRGATFSLDKNQVLIEISHPNTTQSSRGCRRHNPSRARLAAATLRKINVGAMSRTRRGLRLTHESAQNRVRKSKGTKEMKYILMMNCPRNGYEAMSGWSKNDLRAHIAFMIGLDKSLRETGAMVSNEGLASPRKPKVCGRGKTARPLPTASFRSPRNSLRAIGSSMWRVRKKLMGSRLALPPRQDRAAHR